MASALNGTSNGIHNESSKSSLADLDASRLTVTLCKTLRTIPDPSQLVFGSVFTDHMLLVEYDPATGWGAPKVQPYQPLLLDPASHCLHYSSNLFEGMKAYVGPDGEPLLFRPDLNMKRMLRSTERLALPTFNSDALLELIKKLVSIDKRWIPNLPNHSLYVRPTLIGTLPTISVVPSTAAKLYVILSPTGPFFRTEGGSSIVKPVALLGSYDHVRSWPGGTGGFKLGGNYSPCIMPQVLAAKAGYQQILWLLEDAEPADKDPLTVVQAVRKSPEMRITEAGQMNFFAVLSRDDGGLDLITPPLDGTVLPGVTRDSILKLARFHSLPKNDPNYACLPNVPSTTKVIAQERKITIEEVERLNKQSKVLEAFGAGTAAVVSPIGRIGYNGRDIIFPEYPGGFGMISKAMLDALESIFVGKVKSPWSVRCE